MSWRTVVISQRSKLDYSQGYLVCRGEQLQKVHLSEIHTVIVESTAVSLTAALLCELVHQGVKVIFCDECYNPQSELVPYSGSYDAADKLQQQIAWKTRHRKTCGQPLCEINLLNRHPFYDI